jgi:excisionase family DNA binding protein
MPPPEGKTVTDNKTRRWASVKDAAAHLGVTTRTIRQMISDNRLVGYHNGARLVRVDLNELDAAMQPLNRNT